MTEVVHELATSDPQNQRTLQGSKVTLRSAGGRGAAWVTNVLLPTSVTCSSLL